jgi:hypothetical protein
MGQLKPGATYIYERAGNEVYAREFGANPANRTLVGHGYDPITGHKIDYDSMQEDKLWGNIRRAAKTNPALQDALERAIMIYQLSKTDE